VLQRIDKGEGLVVSDIDLSSLATIRARMPIAQHRRL
jgi:predicted amidohydrolase